MHFSVILLLLVSCFSLGYAEIVNNKVDRNIDIASQLVKVTVKLTLENTGKSPVSAFHYALEPDTKPYLSYFGASVSGKEFIAFVFLLMTCRIFLNQ